MMLEKAQKRVKPDGDFGVLTGGKYKAWFYVNGMREFWEQPKALDRGRVLLKSSGTKAGAEIKLLLDVTRDGSLVAHDCVGNSTLAVSHEGLALECCP